MPGSAGQRDGAGRGVRISHPRPTALAGPREHGIGAAIRCRWRRETPIMIAIFDLIMICLQHVMLDKFIYIALNITIHE